MRDCVTGAESYLRSELREPLRARYLAELGCQRDDVDACLWLSIAYRSRALTEPVPGRGEELHHFTCTQRFRSFCAEADVKCNNRREALLAPGVCVPMRLDDKPVFTP
ncbi:MAG: hypothetical protein ACKV2T_35390 [Kofleriaceae bacterium]